MSTVAARVTAANAARKTGQRNLNALTDEELVVYVARWAVTRFPGTWDPDTRDEILSDAYLGAVTAWRTYDPTRGTRLGTWCSHRAIGAILDGLRDRSPYKRDPGADGEPRHRPDLGALSYTQDDATWDQTALAQVDPHYAHTDAADTVTHLLAALPPMDRAIITSVDIDGVTLREAGAEHGITESGACLAKHRGYRRIRAAVPRGQWKELAA